MTEDDDDDESDEYAADDECDYDVDDNGR